MQNLLTVKEVAALLRVSAQTLYKMLDNGEIPAVKVGSQWRFDRDRIRDWLQQRSSEGTTGETVTGRGNLP
jgi:excisionase family DNA binding protein